MRARSLVVFSLVNLLPLSAFAAESAPPASPLYSPDPVQENGDWERHPVAPHIPIALGWAVPFGSLDGHPAAALSDNAGTFTNFEFGVGLRVRRILVDALMFSIGGAGLEDGAMKAAVESLGYEAHGPLRIFFGSDAAYYFKRPQSWAPWLGVRIGYEAMIFGGSSGDRNSVSYSFGGIYMAARGGVDWRIAPAFGLGPVLELGWGRFLSGSATTSVDDDPITPESETRSASEDLDLQGGANHGYVGLGLRVVFFP